MKHYQLCDGTFAAPTEARYDVLDEYGDDARREDLDTLHCYEEARAVIQRLQPTEHNLRVQAFVEHNDHFDSITTGE